MTEDEFRHVYVFLLVHFNGNTFAVVPNGDTIAFSVDLDLNLCHLLVPVQIISSIDDNFI